MQLFSSYESLLWLLKIFANKLVEIETSITTWRQDDRINAHILAGDVSGSNPACLAIIVNVQAMNAVLHVVTSKSRWKFNTLCPKAWACRAMSGLMSSMREGSGLSAGGIPITRSTNALAVARKRVREFLDDHLCPLLQSGALGAQARTALQHCTWDLHLAHLEDAFLMLESVLVHGLDRRCTDIMVWSRRIEQLVYPDNLESRPIPRWGRGMTINRVWPCVSMPRPHPTGETP